MIILDEINVPYRAIKEHPEAAQLFQYYTLYLRCNVRYYDSLNDLKNIGLESRRTIYYERRNALHYKKMFFKVYKNNVKVMEKNI